ncbi:MAG: hypothetical protein ABIA91_03730 [Patescibacteria group bacterium]
MTEKELIKNLKSYGKEFRNQTKISEDQKKAGWDYIYSKIQEDFDVVQEKVKTSFFVRLAENIAAQRLMLKPVATFSLVLVLFVVFSFATVNASNNTLPGNPLYNFKIAAEKTRYILAFSEESRAKMSLDIAKRRANEFTALISRIDSSSTQENHNTVTYVSDQIKNHLTDVKDKFSKMNSEKNSKDVLAMAKVINNDMDDITEEVSKAGGGAKDVLDEVDDIKMVVLAVLVERQEAGDLNLSKEELEEEVVEQIAKISGEVDQAVYEEDINEEQAGLISENVQAAEVLVGESLSESLAKVKEAKGLLNDISKSEVKGVEIVVEQEDMLEEVVEEENGSEGVTSTEPVVQSAVDPFFASEAWELEQEEKVEEFEIKI